MSTEAQASPEFKALAVKAWQQIRTEEPDDAMRYMADNIPIHALASATPQQAEAGGCKDCKYLGLWADRWPGYPNSTHGTIWLFEDGIRALRGPLEKNVYEVMKHEMGHALQRDHVLDEMEKKGLLADKRGQHTRGCGACPGRAT